MAWHGMAWLTYIGFYSCIVRLNAFNGECRLAECQGKHEDCGGAPIWAYAAEAPRFSQTGRKHHLLIDRLQNRSISLIARPDF